jgi:hypothetical protein
VSIKGYFSIWGQTSKRLALAIVSISGLVSSIPALAADITVASPVNGTTIAAPIWVRAHNVGCDGLPPTAFGYSVDGSGTLVRGVTKYDIDVIKVPMSAGTHTIHFKSWTTNGICPVVSTTFKIGSGGSSSGGNTSGGSSGSAVTGSIPANAIGTGSLDGKFWPFEKDAGTPGSARGSTVYPARTPAYDNAREFYMTYARRGGVRWHLSFAKDAGVTHFVYDTYVYITDPSQVGNIELDMNQVMSNGQTVIYGTQCSTYTKTWEYTIFSGGAFRWRSSNVGCNPRNWAANTWHHIQIASHRDSGGNVTYDWVNVDGAHHVFSNAKGYSAHNLGWARGNLLINFQLDGFNTGSGSITSYIHKMTIFRW